MMTALFAEGAGGFVVSVSTKNLSSVTAALNAAVVQYQILVLSPMSLLSIGDEQISIADLKDAWTREL